MNEDFAIQIFEAPRRLASIATKRAEVKMSSRPAKLLIFALSFTAMTMSSAQAAQKARKPAAPQATAGSAVPCRGANLFHCGPVYNGNDYLGSDPDPFIRLMIQRDLGARYGGGP
jgi:hypothetical protein